MITFFKNLHLLFTYGPELTEVVETIRKNREEKEMEDKRYNLNLCFNHQQEEYHSNYAEMNCDYCKLVKQLEDLSND
jgi:hypothetical protein